MAGRLKRGDVLLCRFGRPDKQRPVVVLTRDSAISYLHAVTVAPITSTIRGVPSEVVLGVEDGMKTPCAVNLFHAVTVERNRLVRYVSHLRAERMEQVCSALRFALQCGS